MKTAKMLIILVVALVLVVCQGKVSEAVEMGAAFTYQGHLYDANVVANGEYDFQFKLYDDVNQVGSDVNVPDVDVIDGYFTVELDFGSDVFTGDARWLEIGVRPLDPNGSSSYTVLSPRQEVTATPYAIYAQSVGSAAGMIGGSGAANYIPKFTGATTLGNSVIYESGGDIGIGTTGPGDKLDVDGHVNSSESYKLDGSTVLSNTGPNSIFVGHNAGYSNTTGYSNTFLGNNAGNSNTEGYFNTFLGEDAGNSNTTGSANTFLGWHAGYHNEGDENTFLGYAAGYWHTTGTTNTFLGQSAGYSNITGSGNVFIGYLAGIGETGSNKLCIANTQHPLIYGEFDTKKVGIDTNSPTEKFEVAGSAKITGDLKVDGSYYDSSSDAGTSGQILSSTGSGTDWIDVSGDITAVNAGTGLSGGGTSGDVTLNIDVPLSLSGSVVSPGAVIEGTNTGSGRGVHGTSSSGTGVHGSSSSGNGVYGYSLNHYAVFGLTSSGYAGYFDGKGYFSGNVGIGVTEPSEDLDVAGTARLRGISAQAGATYVHVDGNGKLWKITSSKKYKTNIRELNSDPMAVLELRPVKYQCRVSGKEDVGLIAEEVEQVTRDLVIHNDDGNPEAVKYDRVALYLLAVVKQLKAENTTLSQRVGALERMIQQRPLDVAKEVQQ